MFQNNSQNNSKEEVNVNTKSIQLMNKDGFEPSTLLFVFWNDMLSVKMHPAFEPAKRSETRVFDYSQTVMTSIGIDKVFSLIHEIEKDILPAMEKGVEKNIGVPIGNGKHLIVISTGKKLTGEIRPFLGIYQNIDKDTKKPAASITYEFKALPVIKDYDPMNGTCEVESSVTELHMLVEFLKRSLDAQCNSVAHSIRHADKFFRDRLMNDITSIAKKVGAEVGGSKYDSKSNPDIFGTRKASYSTNASQTDYSGSTISDLDVDVSEYLQ